MEYLYKLQNIYKNQKSLHWCKVDNIDEDDIIKLNTTTDTVNNMDKKLLGYLNKIAILKLNGGLGTSMGCSGPKSSIIVKNNYTFIDIICKQIECLNKDFKSNIPLIFMNSLNTDQITKDLCQKYSNLDIYHFNQNFLPRLSIDLNQTFLENEEYNEHNKDKFYPPGHGDVYQALIDSGMLNKLQSKNIEYLFISNSDNLGATLDLRILDILCSNKIDFLMEVVPKTLADVKGGALIKYENKNKLLEVAQVPKENLEEFYDITKFKYFNTNNIWMKIELLNKGIPNMDVIYNEKKLDNNTPCVQLEIAMGSAIKYYDNSKIICVNRERFRPVKKCADLFLIQSNLFSLDPNYNLIQKVETLPLVNFSDKYKYIDDFNKAFPKGIPDISKLTKLHLNEYKIFDSLEENKFIGNVEI